MEGKEISIVTNSLPIFEKLKDFPNYDLILVGGRYRVKTQTFVGQFANKLLKEIKVSKAFIGVNGIDGHSVSTANEEEGNGNAIILNNAIEKYVVADNSKFDSYSFYSFYRVEDLNAIITDDSIPKEDQRQIWLVYENHLRSRGWDKSPSLSIVFGLSSKTQWLSGLYYADFISFYSPTQLCGGGTTKSNSNELPISVPLSFYLFNDVGK